MFVRLFIEFVFDLTVVRLSGLPDVPYYCQNALLLCDVDYGQWFACFIAQEGYCWRKTAESQASMLRVKYLKAWMRQDIVYIDMNIPSTFVVIDSVCSDNLELQDAISEKVKPNVD